MEYNTLLYKVFKFVKATNNWLFIRTFYTYTEASRYCNEHKGVYVIEGEQSHD